MKTCPDCNGDDGVVEKGTDDEEQCPTCGGSGFVPDPDDDHEEVINTSQLTRTVLKISPLLAPYFVVVIPLSKQVRESAYQIYLDLLKSFLPFNLT